MKGLVVREKKKVVNRVRALCKAAAERGIDTPHAFHGLVCCRSEAHNLATSREGWQT